MPIDLDAAKAARREAKAESLAVIFGGTEYALPEELPFEVVEKLAELADAQGNNAQVARVIMDIVRLLLGNRIDEFMAQSPSMADLEVLFEGAMAEYGFGSTEE